MKYYTEFPPRDGLIVRKIQGSKMYLDVKERGVSRGLILEGVREGLCTKIIKEELKRGMTVVDIGANIGYYTLLEASLVGKDGRVYAFEPFPHSFALLNKSIEINDYSSIVETYQVAISDKCGTAKLYLAEADNIHTLVDLGKARKHIDVNTITLDEFLKDKGSVDFIRMDIEGYEVEVFDGMMETLKREKELKILFELHQNIYSPNRCLRTRLEKLVDLGYKPKYVVATPIPRPQKFIDLGYEPKETMRTDGFHRGLYDNISTEDLFEVAFCLPRIVRYILMEKVG